MSFFAFFCLAKCLTKSIKCTYNQIPTNVLTAQSSRTRPVPSANPVDYSNFAVNSYLPPDPSSGGIANAAREARIDLMRRAALPLGAGSGITDDSILYGGYRDPYMRSDTELPFRYHPDFLPQFNNLPPLPPAHQTSLPHGTLPPGYPPHDARPGTSGEGFSSAFGLMSLDDPNVLAGLTEHQPFFEAVGQSIYDVDPYRNQYNNYVGDLPYLLRARVDIFSASFLPLTRPTRPIGSQKNPGERHSQRSRPRPNSSSIAVHRTLSHFLCIFRIKISECHLHLRLRP